MKILEILTPKRKTGNKGESYAVRHLKRNGYKILSRNYVGAGAEIDIIAENNGTVAFVEVKTRTLGKENKKETRPAASVTPEKQRKIISAAKYYLGTHQSKKKVSLDVIEVYLDGDKRLNKIFHIENAFNLNTAYGRFGD